MKKIAVLLFVFLFSFSFFSYGAMFSDVEGHWGKDYIEFLATEGVINGMGDGCFAPDDFVTREQFLKMLMIVTSDSANEKLAYETPEASGYIYEQSPFGDVDVSRWSFPYIKEAFGSIILGEEYGERFEPVKDITREEAAVWLARALNLPEGVANFTDNHLIGKPGLVGAAFENGLVTGFPDGSFGPGEGLTRAQAAVMLKRAEDLNEKLIIQTFETEVKSVEKDLNGDGTAEVIKVMAGEEGYAVKINESAVLGGICTVSDSKYYLIDVDKNDSFVEFAIAESYYGWGALAIYRYTGTEAYLMGYIESVGGISLRTDNTPIGDEWGAISANADGSLTGNVGEQFIHTMLLRKHYKLNDRNRLVPSAGEFYTMGSYSDFVVAQNLISDKEDEYHPAIELKAGYAGKIVKTDLKNWIYIETGSGDSGWIYVNDDGLLRGEPIYYYLEGLHYAG